MATSNVIALCRVEGGLEGLAPDLAQQLEEVHREGPDLCGMAVMPAAASSGNSDSTLLRLGFLGHVSVEQFCDPVDPPIDKGAHAQAAVARNAATYNIFEARRVRSVPATYIPGRYCGHALGRMK